MWDVETGVCGGGEHCHQIKGRLIYGYKAATGLLEWLKAMAMCDASLCARTCDMAVPNKLCGQICL